MRIKVIYKESEQKLKVNVLKTNQKDPVANEIIIPKETTQHISYPSPNELHKELDEFLQEIVSDYPTTEFIKISNDIKALNDQRRELMMRIRSELNPKIIQKCSEFKEEHAEYFI